MQELQERGAAAAPAEFVGQRVPVGSPVYNRIVEFLYEEAELLDGIHLQEWATRLANDLVYTAPLRTTRTTAEQKASVVRTTQHYHDDYRSVMGRVMRLSGKSAWAEDPPSRTRRLVTNIRVRTMPNDGEYAVSSYLLMTRSRFNFDEFDFISGERNDVLRADGESFKLARREVLLDQAVLGTPNLAVFL
ncbi:3-phenylpropionate/cinnamic acid dioxygenase subunit beta [Pseudorhodoferax sp. LjRoot39]|uniref:3-phenylpropionate/cinnamic acid dioxygenase subunit beta n=1 Tax=Pseudorhodoferax sp. LjRoot39 TaxID=3342328 RepID=UPI003ED01F39